MGVDYYSYLTVGVCLSERDWENTAPIRGCSHQEVRGANFCPVCGASMWKEERVAFIFVDGIDDFLWDTDDFETSTENRHVVGVKVQEDSEGRQKMGDLNLVEIEEKVRTQLANQGLKSDGPFGFYLVKRVSY